MILTVSLPATQEQSAGCQASVDCGWQAIYPQPFNAYSVAEIGLGWKAAVSAELTARQISGLAADYGGQSGTYTAERPDGVPAAGFEKFR